MLNEMGAAEIVRRLARREITSSDVVEASLQRIAAREPEVQAWAHIDPERARAAAAESDRSGSGPLRGLPVGIKDNFDTADMPTVYGSSVYAGHQPAADAACVTILREAGAVILGKTVTTEFACFNPARTRNPRNLDHAPGGSSSGSAAAVADNMVSIALGTQTGGSVIRPAAFCGVVGYKASFGLINRGGIKPAAENVDTVGLMARKVEDAGLVAAVLMGVDPLSMMGDLARPPAIGIYRGPHWEMAEPAAIACLDAAAKALSAAGARVSEIDPPAILVEASNASMVAAGYEMSRALGHEWRNHRAAISAKLLPFLEQGWRTPQADYLDAVRTVERARRWLEGAFGAVDAWLTLPANGEAPPVFTSIGDSSFNRLWSASYLPAITLPAGKGPKGLPLGVQLIGPMFGDAKLMSVAKWCEGQLAKA
jgi:Asp-tRNA(Asn)/Glu-tRNA(Gln) amidotransferase A subunit family amidase